MANRRDESRAVKQAGGGHRVAADAALHLPWAGIFEPWRPFVAVAAAADAAKCRKKKPASLKGLQLDLEFSPYYVKPPAADPARPLFDLFPEAYQ